MSERGVKNRVVQERERERVRCKRWVRVMGEVQVVGWDLGKRVGCRGERKGKLRVCGKERQEGLESKIRVDERVG